MEVLGPAALSQDSHAGQAALLTGKVQGGISSKVSQLRITASFQKRLGDLWLVGDHRQVERSLQTEEGTERMHYGSNPQSEFP